MSLQEVLFISEEKLKSFTSINNNVSPLDLIPYVLTSQDIFLQNYIGATYYMQLKEQVRLLTFQNEELIKKQEELKFAKSLLGADDDSHEAKLKINRIVREIDKCIALLNK